MKKILIIDFSNMLYASFFIAYKEKDLVTISDKKDYWRYLLLKMILNIRNRYRPDELILAVDSKNTWRKDYFKYYKARRVLRKSKDDIDWDDFHTTSDMFIEELKSSLACKIIKIEKAEADDVIATLALNLKYDHNVIIATRDKDFQQLLIYDNISIHDFMSDTLMTCPDVNLELHLHLLKGDSSDDIPNLLSDDNVFVNSSKRQKSITKGIIQEVIDYGIEKFAIKNNLVSNYERNVKLIKLSLDTIPEYIQDETMYQYYNIKNEANFETLMEYIRAKSMYSLLEEI